VVVSPKPAPETLAAAHLLGITEFYRLGGAHAVAALAYGTASIPRVDKIVGAGQSLRHRGQAPGRLRLRHRHARRTHGDCRHQRARQRGRHCLRPCRAGRARSRGAGHLHHHARRSGQRVIAEAKLRSRNNPSRARLSIATASIVARSTKRAQITNRLAPEHLTVDAASDLDWVENAGSVFVGRWSAQPMGDYISGPNHTLPTGGMARVRGGLSVNDFVKLITVQEYTAQGHARAWAESRAAGRGRRAHGHAEAIRTRLQKEEGPVTESVTTIPAPRARVQAMKEYHPPLGSRDALRLDFNENTLACSPKVREVLARISAGALTRYPEREPVEAIVAAHLGLRPEQVALTNGVDEAIHVLFETFLEAGDELLLPVPTYTMYEVYASATDARVVAVQAADDLQFPFERLLAAITPRTKIIAIANPNSPSGSVATRAQFLRSRGARRRRCCWWTKRTFISTAKR
jgi:hypothetical protein